MLNRLFLLFSFLCFHCCLQAEQRVVKKHYDLSAEPIDVVIVSHPKDKGTLDFCIDGIRENGENIRRIIVVSSERLSDKAEWFNEKDFPFTLNEVVLAIGREDKKTAERYFYKHWRPPGWYLQQLLKLYAPFIIPGISSNVLVVDADTVFMNPVSFLNESNGGLFCVSHLKAKERYLKFAERLVPGYKRIYPHVYSVCHHMLFQRAILEDLFASVEKHHHTVFWKAFCYSVDLGYYKGASEYEVYYNFALNRTKQVEIRELQWKNTGNSIDNKNAYQKQGYHFVSFQDYMRK